MNTFLFKGNDNYTGRLVQGYLGFKMINEGILSSKEQFRIYDIEEQQWYNVYQCSIGQSIGKLDKNDKLIFTRDIAKFGNEIGYIDYDETTDSVVVKVYDEGGYVYRHEKISNVIKILELTGDRV